MIVGFLSDFGRQRPYSSHNVDKWGRLGSVENPAVVAFSLVGNLENQGSALPNDKLKILE